MSYKYQRVLALVRANELLYTLRQLLEFEELSDEDRDLIADITFAITSFQIKFAREEEI